MRTLYLHCGLPKTGTTYLQKTFLENRGLLTAAGLGFGPYEDPATGSHYPEFVNALIHKGATEVLAETAACAGDNILVSNEDLLHYMLDPSPAGGDRLRAHDIQDAAAGLFDIRIIVYVRRQDGLKESIFSQIVKEWYCGDIGGIFHYDFDLNGKLRRISEVFGVENVRANIFGKGGADDILTSFLRSLDLDIPPETFAPTERQNTSMHRRKVLFLSQLPKKPTALTDLRDKFPPRFITRVVDKTASIADDGGKFIMSPQERYDLVAEHQEGNRDLVARHGIKNPGDFCDLPDPEAPWQPPAPITAREIRAVWGETLSACRTSQSVPGALRLGCRTSLLFAKMGRGA